MNALIDAAIAGHVSLLALLSVLGQVAVLGGIVGLVTRALVWIHGCGEGE